jgi:Fe-S-cluster containining protein
MAEFVCTRCGKCCMHFGRYIAIERTISPSEFLCRFTLKNERFSAKVPAEYGSLFATRPRDPGAGSWCTFLRKGDGGGFICTIHAHRPTHCRNYRCFTMTITGRNGTAAGRIGSGKNLITSDTTLASIWEQGIRPLPAMSNHDWEETVRRILGEHGYRVERVE